MSRCVYHEPIGGPHFRKCDCGNVFWIAGSHDWARDKCLECEFKHVAEQLKLVPEKRRRRKKTKKKFKAGRRVR